MQSINKNWDQLCTYSHTRLANTDVIVITEVNLDTSTLSRYTLTAYSQVALCRETRKGGGVVIFVNDNWVFHNIAVTFKYAEVVIVTLNKIDVTYTICAIYRPPNMNTDLLLEELNSLLKKYMNEQQLILVGHFNTDVM